MSTQELLFKIALLGALLAILQWFVIYTVKQPWWRDKIGRNLMYFAGCVVGLIVGPTMSLFFDLNRFTSEIVGWVDLGLVALIIPVFLNRTIIWLRESTKGRGEDKEPW